MNTTLQTMRKDEQGFTLVELAVVMIIIGLLIGGILKGQELITNARVTSTIAQMESITAAYQDFRGQFNALPGDMNTAAARIGNCGALACADGDGDGVIDQAIGAAMAAPAAAGVGENTGFFLHLLGANYLSGYTGNSGTISFGTSAPATPLGGGFSVGVHPGAATAGFAAGRQGLYLTVQGVVGAQAPANGILTATQAQRIDTKLDDGLPSTGSILGNSGNTDGTTTCATLAATGGTYNGVSNALCSIAYRM
ncbi:MAG: prepilin-type N-terminal cleavage/methylation domain-containing protein [Alphaproteobacteria bacterium]|nr:prepilin-type N-terminal cleavage/methylation domain-containing protein [Alphaproteobacteria bacterium]